jgi:hypothetical protein
VPESLPFEVLPLKGPLTATELLIVFTVFPPPELVVPCVTETELVCSCLPEPGAREPVTQIRCQERFIQQIPQLDYPNGSMCKASFGNGLTHALACNNRLQRGRINLNSRSSYFSTCTGAVPSGNILDFTLG